MRFAVLAVGVAFLAVVHAEPRVRLARAYPNLVFDDNATAVAVAPDSARHTVVALQRGQIRVLPENRESPDAPLFLDLRERMKEETEFEEGIHGLAFHPNFAVNRRVYLCYSQRGPRRTVLSEFMVPEGKTFQADARSERVVLEWPHPMGNHWGGCIAFGPDACLYVAIGDGGLRDDPYRLGQNLWTLHGKILRLDVDGRSAGLAYKIPADNPFGERQEMRNEIWAAGLRNPWGMSFDRRTGTLWCGDVGQDSWEEINLIKPGGNYGWSEREGALRFAGRSQTPQEGGPFIDPIHCYGHEVGISVTGGFVYRGNRLPSLQGRYLFGDWGKGKLWAMSWDAASGTANGVDEVFSGEGEMKINPTVIAPDAEGEPLVFSHYPSCIFTLEEPVRLVETEISEEAAVEALPDPGEGILPSVDEMPEVEVEDAGG